jgi:hypothetical protein
VVVERVRAPEAPPVAIGDRVLTLVRFDPSRYRLRFLTPRDGAARPATDWVRDHRLAAAINAGMFTPSGRPVGLMVQDGRVVNDRDHPLFGGFLAFDARGVRIAGRGCPGDSVERLRSRYRNVLQSYRMLDCGGRAIAWADPKAYSVAAVGLDGDGRIVLFHARTPYRVRDLNRMLAAPALRLRAMLFMEGGPEASLVVDAEGERVEEVGSYETGFFESDDNRRFWELPNVIAIEAAGRGP